MQHQWLITSFGLKHFGAQSFCALRAHSFVFGRMPKFAPASISGVGQTWWLNQSLRDQWDQAKSLVQKNPPSLPMVTQDRWHAVNNLALIEPIIAKMRAAHILKTPSIEQLQEELVTFHAWRESDGKLDEKNPPEITVDETVLHLDAASIKKVLSFCRTHYKRPHVPRDWGSKKKSVTKQGV